MTKEIYYLKTAHEIPENKLALFMYVPVPSQEPVIQWLSFVYMLHICFFRSFFFLHELFYIVLSGIFIADNALYSLLKAVR